MKAWVIKSNDSKYWNSISEIFEPNLVDATFYHRKSSIMKFTSCDGIRSIPIKVEIKEVG